MRDSGVWKTVESSYFERIKTLICQQLSRQSLGGSVVETGCSKEGGDVLADRCGTPGKDWKSCPELVEEMEPKCSTTYQHDVASLRQLELMEKETISATGGVALSAIQKDLEARQTSARKKVRCRQHRLDCILEVFELEAESIISQLESYEGTEVDFSSSQRVMRLKGMMKEAILTAENLGSAKREVITVELISSSCALMRQLLSRLNEQRTELQPAQKTALKVEETVLPSEVPGEEHNIHCPTEQRCEIQQVEGCGSSVTPQRSCSVMDEKTTEKLNNDRTSFDAPDDDSATKDVLAPTLTFSSSSYSSSSSSSSSCAESRVTSPYALPQKSFSFFRIPFLGTCSYYSLFLFSSLLFLLSSLRRATPSEQRVRLRSKLSSATPKFVQKLVNGFKDFFRGKVKVEDTDEMKNRADERHQEDAGSCASAIEVGLAGSWIGWQLQRMRSSLESVCERKSWHWMVHQVMGWLSSATAWISILQGLPGKLRRRGWATLTLEDRCAGWMWSIGLLCFVVWIVSIICFDQSPTVAITMIGRMIQWILFDSVVDLRHHGLPPI